MPQGSRRVRSVLPTDEIGLKEVARWRKLLDPELTTPEEFHHAYKIPTKLVARLGGSSVVRFTARAFQLCVGQIIDEFWKREEGAKFFGLKGRQEGLTTYMCLVAWERFMRGGGGTGNYYSYDDPHSVEAFSLLVNFKRQTPMWVFEHLMHERVEYDLTNEGKRVPTGYFSGGGEWKKKSAKQLLLAFPGGVDHLLQCATAGGRFSGSGSAPRWVFLDEFTKYPDKVKADFTGISEGWQDGPGNGFFVWGTGQGKEKYEKMFMDHYGKKDESGIVSYFKPWMGHPDRSRAFGSARERMAFIESIGKVKDFGVEEELSLQEAGATPEELNWRRNKLAGLFNYDLKKFSREYPKTTSDAFASDAAAIFDIETLQTHEAAAQERERAAKTGEFEWREDDKVVFVESRSGKWTLYEAADPEGWYCYGTDSASGSAPQAEGTSGELDWSVAEFDEVYTGRTVAKYRAQVKGSDFGHEIDKACFYFKNVVELQLARGYPENNHESGRAQIDAMATELDEKGYFVTDAVLEQEGELKTDGSRGEPTLGWFTSESKRDGSKGIAIDNTVKFIREVGPYKPGAQTPYTLGFLTEAYSYQRIKGKARAARGHDDEVMAKMLAVTARVKLLDEELVPKQSKRVVKPDYRDALERQMAEEGARREDRRVLTIDADAARRGVVKHKIDTSKTHDPVLGRMF